MSCFYRSNPSSSLPQKGMNFTPKLPISTACLAEFQLTPDGWVINEPKQYYFNTDKVPKDKARAFCKKNFGDLAVIENNSERLFLFKYVRHS